MTTNTLDWTIPTIFKSGYAKCRPFTLLLQNASYLDDWYGVDIVPILPKFVERWQSMYNLVLTTERSEGTLNVPWHMPAWDI